MEDNNEKPAADMQRIHGTCLASRHCAPLHTLGFLRVSTIHIQRSTYEVTIAAISMDAVGTCPSLLMMANHLVGGVFNSV